LVHWAPDGVPSHTAQHRPPEQTEPEPHCPWLLQLPLQMHWQAAASAQVAVPGMTVVSAVQPTGAQPHTPADDSTQ
jgi:hypothetical protein